MQIRGDFRVRKIGVGLQDLLRSFTLTDATARRTFFGLTITKKRELWKMLKELLW